MRLERNRQGLTDDEMMARSGLDREAIETMEAYAKALGKKRLIVLTDEDVA